MGLITLGLPADVVQHIKNLIVEQSKSLEGEEDSSGKAETVARIAKWQAFIKFTENQDPLLDVEVFPLSVSGSGSSANLMILEAFYTRDSEGSAIVLNDQPTINKLKNALYRLEDPKGPSAYFNVCKPNYFEWWEKDSPDNRLRGIVRINK